MRNRVLEDNWFYCHHISDDDSDDICGFRVKNPQYSQGLANYLIKYALNDEAYGMMRTYLVRDTLTDELVGYFSLKSGMVSFNEHIDTVEEAQEIVFDTLPGIELANFAVDQRYRDVHPTQVNIGLDLFNSFVRKLAVRYSKEIGTFMLYIFALPQETLIERYAEKYGFLRLNSSDEQKLHKRMKPRYDTGCIFMYQLLNG